MNMNAKVFADTSSMSREEWLKYRTTGIGGSDVSVIAGINPYRSVFQLWLEKTGQTEPCESGNECTHFGTVLEPIVKQEFTERTGIEIAEPKFIYQHPDYLLLLLEHIKNNYPDLYFVSSTTKVQTDFDEFLSETKRSEFKYIVPDFRLNKQYDKLAALPQVLKDKVEFLCNECCSFYCKDRKACYENVSRKNLGESCEDHICKAPDAKDGYRFSRAMKNPAFISTDDIINIYLPLGFSNFKIEGRGLGSAVILEFLLYYLTKPEYRLTVREEIYLDSMLDIF